MFEIVAAPAPGATGNNRDRIMNHTTIMGVPNESSVSKADRTIRIMGMLMTVSLLVIALLFIYILYTMSLDVAGKTAIVVLLFIAIVFIILLAKTLQLMNKLTPEGDFEQPSIVTIEELFSVRDAVPPAYDEVMKNMPVLNKKNSDDSLPKYSQVVECPRCSYSIINENSVANTNIISTNNVLQ